MAWEQNNLLYSLSKHVFVCKLYHYFNLKVTITAICNRKLVPGVCKVIMLLVKLL